jgi:hypothetical protein
VASVRPQPTPGAERGSPDPPQHPPVRPDGPGIVRPEHGRRRPRAIPGRSHPRGGSLLPSGPSRREWGAGPGRCRADNRLHMPAVAFSASVPSAGTA